LSIGHIRWEFTQPDPVLVREARKAFNVPEVYARILVQRGIVDREIGAPFFNPGFQLLHDPFLMRDMDTAVDRILEQVRRQRPTLVFGDYDVDGTTGASLLFLFLRSLGARVSTYIPDRESEGYGLSPGGIDYAVLIGADLLITCDCGINAHDTVAYARDQGIDVIITDHHIPDTSLPEALAILNPKRPDCDYPFQGLCGAGVAFKLTQALVEKGGHDPELAWQYADLVALGTAADIVPLMDENRIIVSAGLRLMEEHPRPGIAALWQVSGMVGKDLTVGRLVFGIAPKINAAGRLGDAGRAVKLLTTDNHYLAMSMARELVAENTRRQQIQAQTVEEAIFQVNAHHDLDQENALVLWDESWHPGVIGIVAARIRDIYRRPTAIIAVSDSVGKGSLRSMAGFDLYQALTRCKQHLTGYGGHAVAAGLSVSRESLPAFSAAFVALANDQLTPDDLAPRQRVEGECSLSIIDSRFLRFLRSLEPYGPGNMRPVIASRGIEVVGLPRLLGDSAAHLKFQVRQDGATFDAIGFDMADHYEKLLLKQPLDIAYVVEENTWRGNRQVQLHLKDIKLGEST